MDKQRWPMGDEWRVSECDQPWVINDGQTLNVMSGEYQNVISPGLSTMDKQRWPMGDEWRVSECDQPWVINDGQTEMTHGWWVESIRMWSALGYQRWTNRDDPWVMSGEYQNVISPGLPTMDKQRWPMGDALVTQGWSHSDTLHSSPMGHLCLSIVDIPGLITF